MNRTGGSRDRPPSLSVLSHSHSQSLPHVHPRSSSSSSSFAFSRRHIYLFASLFFTFIFILWLYAHYIYSPTNTNNNSYNDEHEADAEIQTQSQSHAQSLLRRSHLRPKAASSLSSSPFDLGLDYARNNNNECKCAPCPPPPPPPPQLHQAECPKCPHLSSSSSASSSSSSSSSPSARSLAACMSVPVPALEKDDLSNSITTTNFDISNHEITYEFCYQNEIKTNTHKQILYCPEDAKSEWWWQLRWYDRTDSRNKTGAKISRESSIKTPDCVQLPPPGYVFPPKYPPLPADFESTPEEIALNAKRHRVDENHEQLSHEGYVNWGNLRVSNIKELLTFNSGTPKNLYHFDAIFYDSEQLKLLYEAARYIPFFSRVRLMLDVGAGGGSLGLLAKRIYDVTTVATVFADWPYCEYISERGGICMLLDVMTALPFAKYTYDVVHASWVYHGSSPSELWSVFLEHYRVLRPGGYLWWNGGWSLDQVSTLSSYASSLGMIALFDSRRPVTASWSFGTKGDIPYQVDWTVILLKPIRAKLAPECKYKEPPTKHSSQKDEQKKHKKPKK